MRIVQLFGLILVVAGAWILFKGLTYSSSRNVVEVGEFKAAIEEKRAVPPWVGGAGIALGVVVLIAGSRRS